MVDINLLPEELRKKEEQKKKDAEKKPPLFEVKLSVPEDAKIEEEKRKSGLFAGVLPNKKTPAPQEPMSPYDKEVLERRSRAYKEGREERASLKDGRGDIEPIDRENIHVAPIVGEERYNKQRREPLPRPGAQKVEAKKELPKAPLPSMELKVPKKGTSRPLFSFFSRSKKEKPSFVTPKEIKPIFAPVKIDEVKALGDVKKEARKKMGFWAWLKSLFRRKKKNPKTPALPAIQPVVKPKVVETKMPTLIVADAKKIATPLPPGIPLKPAVTMKKEEFIFSPIVQRIPVPPKPQGMGKSAIPEATPVMAGGKKQKIGKSPAKKPAPYDDIHEPVETLEINLIPEDLVQHPELDIASRLTVLIVSVLGSCAVIFGWFLYVQWEGWDISEKNKEIQSKIDTIKTEARKYDEDRKKVEELIAGLSSIENLLNSHVHWTRVFTKLEQYTVPDVYFTNFAATKDGGLRLSAVGKDYSSVAHQLLSFQRALDFVSSVEINSASAQVQDDPQGKSQVTGTSFDVVVQMVPEIFYIKYENK